MDIKSLEYSLHKFDGTKFALWKFQLKIILESKELSDITFGLDPKPDDAAKLREWVKRDSIAKAIITCGLSNTQKEKILTCNTAEEMMKRLETIHEQKSGASKHILHQEFFAATMTNNEDVSSFISRIESLASQLRDTGKEISENDLIIKILCGLNQNFKSVITAWDSVPEKDQTLNELISRLLKEELMLKRWSKEDSTVEAALIASNKTQIKKQKGNLKDIEAKKKNSKCGFCKEKGHWWRECKKRLNEQKNKKKTDEAKTSHEEEAAFTASTVSLQNDTEYWITDQLQQRTCPTDEIGLLITMLLILHEQ